MMIRRQHGFTLVTAIFLLVAIAGLIAAMVSLSSVQHTTVAQDLRGARAMEAARSAMDYAIFRVLIPGGGGCAGVSSPVTFPSAALQDFSAEILCTSSVHIEDVTVPIQTTEVFNLTVTASAGNYALGANRVNPDYVSRRLRATVSENPP